MRGDAERQDPPSVMAEDRHGGRILRFREGRD
jgi:hypothetical protein